MRKPNFKVDDTIYGKFGENDFFEYCKTTEFKYVVDVSKDDKCCLADVDALVSKTEIPKYTPREMTELLFSRDKIIRDVYKFEIKTDTRSRLTRNIVYEVISHDFAGCMAESKADYVYYVFISDEKGDGSKLKKQEVWIIDLTRLRKYLRETFFSNKYTFEQLNNEFGLRGNNYNTNDDRVANILCNIEKLEQHDIARCKFKIE